MGNRRDPFLMADEGKFLPVLETVQRTARNQFCFKIGLWTFNVYRLRRINGELGGWGWNMALNNAHFHSWEKGDFDAKGKLIWDRPAKTRAEALRRCLIVAQKHDQASLKDLAFLLRKRR